MFSQITFLYYDDLAPAATFYEEVLGLERVEDQGWARIYRLAGGAFLGIVAGEKGYHRPQPRSAVLLTLVVDDVPAWYRHLAAHGVKLLSEVQDRPEIQIRCFFLEDPGGYTLEIQQFLRPDLIDVFYRQGGGAP
jgi:predicted enzyme related to lactoylglutathione lyase